MHLHDAGAEFRILHAAHVVRQKEHLRVANVGDKVYVVRKHKTAVGNFLLVQNSPVLEVFFPCRTERRVRNAEVVSFANVAVLRDGRAKGDVVALLLVQRITEALDLARNHDVRLAGGVSIGHQFLTENVNLDFLIAFTCHIKDFLLGNRQDSARTAGSIVNGICRIFKFVRNRENRQVGKQLHHVAWRKVTTGASHRIGFVEAAEQFLEHRSHHVVIDTGQGLFSARIFYGQDSQVDGLVGKLFENGSQAVVLGKLVDGR